MATPTKAPAPAAAKPRGPDSSKKPSSGRGAGGYGNSRRFKPKSTRFEGATEELRGSVFDLGYDQSELYAKTSEQVAIYVGKTYSYGGRISVAIETLKPPNIATPPAPPGYGTEKVNAADKFVWEAELKDILRDRKELTRQIAQLYSLVVGQCSEPMVARIEAHPDYKKTSDDRNDIGLLRIVRSICYDFQDHKYSAQSIFEAKRRWYNCHQNKGETISQYYEKFQNCMQVVEQCGGSINLEPGMRTFVCEHMEFDVSALTDDEKKIV
ncbi:MAG: hypothetical protein SGARI_002947, partial [Bacillariaceae sp.]